MAEACAGIQIHWSKVKEGAMVLLLHHGLLQTMEGLNSGCSDYNCQLPPLKAHLSLPDTKTSKRRWRSESVGLYDAKVVKLLTMLCENRQPGDKVYSGSAATFRKQLRWALSALHIQVQSMRPRWLNRLFQENKQHAGSRLQRPMGQLRNCKADEAWKWQSAEGCETQTSQVAGLRGVN